MSARELLCAAYFDSYFDSRHSIQFGRTFRRGLHNVSYAWYKSIGDTKMMTSLKA